MARLYVAGKRWEPMNTKRKQQHHVMIITAAAMFFTHIASASNISGGSEGSNVVDIQRTGPNRFTCKLATPPMPPSRTGRPPTVPVLSTISMWLTSSIPIHTRTCQSISAQV